MYRFSGQTSQKQLNGADAHLQQEIEVNVSTEDALAYQGSARKLAVNACES